MAPTLEQFLDREYGLVPGVAETQITQFIPQQSMDQSLMESAILHTLRVLDNPKLKKLSPERVTAGILSVYDAAKAQGKASVTEADVTPLVRLLMA